MSAENRPRLDPCPDLAWQGCRPIRIRPPERDAAGSLETALSPDEVRVAIRDGWTYTADVLLGWTYTADVLLVERRRVQIINFEEQAP